MQPFTQNAACEGSNGTCTTPQYQSQSHKPIEIYSFIDPLCPECWGLEPIIKKLTVEYSQYFTLRYVIGNQSTSHKYSTREKIAHLTGMSYDGDATQALSTYQTSIAVKAAELQGKSAGRKFLRRFREQLFVNQAHVNQEDLWMDCAKSINLDLDEFKKDIESERPFKALQCDRNITSEMDVDNLPAFVFFNISENDEGIKINGRYPYHVYVQVLTELLGETPKPESHPPLEAFMSKYQFVATQEIAMVYDMDQQETEKEMKKLQLRQSVEAVPVKFGTFWRYTG